MFTPSNFEFHIENSDSATETLTQLSLLCMNVDKGSKEPLIQKFCYNNIRHFKI